MPELQIISLSILFSALFSGMEIAYVTTDRMQVEIDIKNKILGHKALKLFYRHPTRYIATMLVGNNIALVSYGIGMALLLEPIFWRLTESAVLVFLLQTVISTIIILVTAEYLPKSIFRLKAHAMMRIFSIPMVVFYIFLYPISVFSTWLSDIFIRRVFHVKDFPANKQQAVFNKGDLTNFLQGVQTTDGESTKEMPNDLKIFQKALDFGDTKARQCMVPRNEIMAIDKVSPLDELTRLFIETGFSRIPVYNDRIDNIIGYFHVSELFNKPKTIADGFREMPIISEATPANVILAQLIQQQKSIALVVDEFGGTAGIVTLEDLVEEIVGEIEDEHDTLDLLEEETGNNTFRLSARLETGYLNEKYDFDIPESQNYKTIAGFIIDHYQDIPQKDDMIELPHLRLTITKVSESKIEEVRVERLPGVKE